MKLDIPMSVLTEQIFEVRLNEVTSDDAPVAFRVHGEQRLTELRFYDDKLWILAETKEPKISRMSAEDLIESMRMEARSSSFSADDFQSQFKEFAQGYLVIDGEIYRLCSEPYYAIDTGGPKIRIRIRQVHSGFPTRMSEYFNALQYEEALKKLDKLLLIHGSDEVEFVPKKPWIEVLIPEAVKLPRGLPYVRFEHSMAKVPYFFWPYAEAPDEFKDIIYCSDDTFLVVAKSDFKECNPEHFRVLFENSNVVSEQSILVNQQEVLLVSATFSAAR